MSRQKQVCVFRLPFYVDMPYFKETIDVPLVFRKITRSEQEIRSSLELIPSDKLILVQFGASAQNPIKNLAQRLYDYHIAHPEVKFLVTEHSKFDLPGSMGSMIRTIPATDAQSQDYLARSDLCIGKTGYSSLAEVVGYGIPFFYCLRENWNEDAGLKKGMDEYGIGKEYSRQQIIDGSWIEGIREGFQLKKTSPKKRIEKYGQDFIANWIEKNY